MALKQIPHETFHKERKKFYCYNESVESKNLGRDEESSPSDFTPEKRKSCLAGKTRTYLWACPLTPTPRPHFSSPCLCKIKMRGSRDLEWRYPSCLLYGKSVLELFFRLQTIYKWYVTKFNYVAMKIFLTGKKKKTRKSSVRVCGRAFFV